MKSIGIFKYDSYIICLYPEVTVKPHSGIYCVTAIAVVLLQKLKVMTQIDKTYSNLK